MFDAVTENRDVFEIECLVAKSNYVELARQAVIAHPKYVSVDSEFVKITKELLNGKSIEVLPNEEVTDLAQLDVDIVGMAISGTAGLAPSFACLGHAGTLAIATKEAVICGGRLFIDQAHAKNTRIIPVDSEHNAIYQCLQNRNMEHVDKIILTCSGGPFINRSKGELDDITISDALKHPKWEMGAKITIDSATLLNKSLEIIEASFLFGIDIEKVEAIIHKESIIHGMVKFKDSSIISLMSVPDMRIPINYAFLINMYEHGGSELDPCLSTLSFQRFNDWQKENVELAYEVYNEEKCIAFTIADEIAVQRFLGNKIKFKDIPTFIRKILESSERERASSVSDIIEICERISLKGNEN
jgi:1-deoxy-D-xylulose-5-phosphate reductoisomerase